MLSDTSSQPALVMGSPVTTLETRHHPMVIVNDEAVRYHLSTWQAGSDDKGEGCRVLWRSGNCHSSIPVATSLPSCEPV